MSPLEAQIPDRTLRVAACQAVAEPGDLTHNAAVAARLVGRAAAEGARLVVLPELFLPGYHPPTLAGEPNRCDVSADEGALVSDPRLDALGTAAAANAVTVVVGASVRAADDRRYLAALLVGPDGVIRDAYHKRHLCGGDEQGLFVVGAQGANLELEGWRLGIGICYDGCFPEHARAVARSGAHGCLYPAAYLRGSEHRRDLYYAARALDNTMFVVLANAVGGPPPWSFNGGSAVHDPQGRTLVRAGDGEESVIVSDLDPALLATTRAEHPMLADSELDEPSARRVLSPGAAL